MLIYEVLKKDHDVIRAILEKMEATKPSAPKTRKAMVERLRSEFIPHARAEERVLYDALKGIDSTLDIALEAVEEHKAVELLLNQLDAIRGDDERWHAKLMVLKENLEHHLEIEEQELFATAEQVIATEEASMMAEAFKKLKAEVHEGSILQSALETVAQYMPERFAHRFTDLSKRLNR